MSWVVKNILAQRRKGAKKAFRNAAALCAFALLREKFFRYRYSLAGFLITAVVVTLFICNSQRSVTAETGDETATLIDAALYTRHEFFGAQAIVPYPTAEARNRLAAVLEKYPNDSRILLKLAQLDEKLGREDEALRGMQAYVEHEPNQQEALTTMAEFFHRRAQFAAEAESIERLLSIAPEERRVEFFRKLIELAEKHRLNKYITPGFYEQIVEQNPSAFEIVEQYQEKLIEQGNYEAALNLLRQNQDRFPEHRVQMIEAEVSLLDDMGRAKEAESAYIKAFDPFWPTELSENFYEFLKDNDRFRTYGHELRAAFRRNPTDVTAAVRLLHYSRYAGHNTPQVFVQLEKARAARNIVWKQEELITITRFLLSEGYGEAASRFLYTLYLQGELKPGSPLRAKVLYQLFELVSDAGEQRLSLTRGDLKFYQDIATADPHPGIFGGILSLILSDTRPKEEFARQEARAIKHFNRAAAYRIFLAYKQEYPTAPELAQMYLDIVRLYAGSKDHKVAAETLAEFENRYGDAPEYAEVALKLADCYIAVQNLDGERAVYQRILDYLGQRRVKGVALVAYSDQASASTDPQRQQQALDLKSEPTTVKPVTSTYPSISNPGINYYSSESTNTDSYAQYSSRYTFPDYLESVQPGNESASSVDYQMVLSRYVASLAKDNRTADILALYSAEIKKYPEEQGLYEQMLQWLGQTNLVDEQLRVYQQALRTFPSTTWHDRLARWFIRQRRTTEFETLSRELLARVNDKEAERYLQEFVQGNRSADPSSFDAKLYITLYSLAHQRFPHNLHFVSGLLQFYSAHKQWDQWRMLVAEYYFESREVREQFLSHLASRNELRNYLARARDTLNTTAAETQFLLPYKLFRADAAAWLSNYEEAIDAYRELNRLYPNSPEFAERLVSFTRSFGQHNRRFLEESATISHALADAAPSVAQYRTRSGEIRAELGDYNKARGEWEQLVPLASGDEETYLDTATIYWDYFQYDDALRTIETLRREMNDPTLYAFQVAVIREDKHQPREALTEYIKALTKSEYYDSNVARARRRLVTLSRRPGVYEQIVAAFKRERRNHEWVLVWEYANFLNDAGRWAEASSLLRDEMGRSDSPHFLNHARGLFETKEETAGQIIALNRLIATTNNQRLAISYRLQLAEVYSRKGQGAQAANVLHALVGKYPNNYGVLSESADFFWRLGQRSKSITVLQSSMERGLGRFHYLFGRKLAARHVEMQQFASAQQVLERLNREDRMNLEVFHELAKVYVRSGNQEGLRTTFRATVEAIKKEDTDPRETRYQIAQLRQEMIGAFTRLGDYASAVEQHIEIINRDPDDEQYVDAAIDYVRRYGGGDTLLKYYQRTSQQAFKNYRWNVVLARIYDAQGDVTNTVQQYRAAIDNQPEMIELYDSVADVYTRAKDYDSALTALRKAQELSNDDPRQVKRTIAVLEKAGRKREAEAERRKLPLETVTPLSVSDQFSVAAQLRSSDLKNAVATYRGAYEAFAASPFKNELRAADIAGYVQTVRSEERLDEITKRLWILRNRIAAEAKTPNSTNAGKAQSLLATFDGAVVDAVGGIATDKATGEELVALFQFLQEQVNATLRDGDRSDTLTFLRNLSRRAGFGSIDEEVLKSLKERAYSMRDWPAYHSDLRALVDLYDRSGAYKQILDLLQAERSRNAPGGFDYPSLTATYARLLGDSSLELQALREHYQKPSQQNQLVTSTDPLIERYFEALWENGAAGRNELLSCAQHPTSHQLQLITFLLTKSDRELVHIAIENSPLSPAWKSSRHAEISLQLAEFEADSENYFTAALKFESIGQLIKQKPDTKQQLVGDEWYRLAQTYGRWLYSSTNAEQRLKSRVLLPARMENRPNDIDEQARLGRWYLERKDLDSAIEHLALAHESEPENKKIIADLGSAFFIRGDKQRAHQLWEKIIDEKPAIGDYRLYLETLFKHNLNEQARKRSMPFVLARLKNDFEDEEDNRHAQPQKQEEDFKSLIRVLAGSFASTAEAAKARFFAQLCAAAPYNRFLPAFLIQESLITKQEVGVFYDMVIRRSPSLSSYESDYSYTALRETNFDDFDAESALDHENDYKLSEPESSRIKWQKEYLDYLIEHRRNADARPLIASIERDLQRRFARPVWLRLASARMDVRNRRVPQAIDRLQWLVGIKNAISVDNPKPPSIERLNDAVAMLADEGQATEARRLLETAYARGIALGHFEPAYFAGLARIAFERGDKSQGLTWLQSMIDLTMSETREQTAAALMAMPLIAAHTAGSPESEDVQFDRTTALRLASETAGEFGAYDAAINFRQQLLTTSPTDEENRIELIRLLAANGKKDEAIQNLAATIADRNATRTLRWQAIWLAREIAGKDFSALSSSDSEMSTALEALSLNAAGRADEATKLIAAAEVTMPTEFLSSLHAMLEKTNASANALNSFTRALIAAQEPTASKSFGFAEDEPLEQIVSLYLKQNQSRAALKVAERIVAFQADRKPAEVETGMQLSLDTRDRYQTLRERAEQRQRTTHMNLLAMLSAAAEQLGDLNRAVELERLRLPLVNTLSERNATQARLDHLHQLQIATARTRKVSLVVDQKLVASD